MIKAHLSACPACRRHIRVTEGSCPFCGGVLNESFRAIPAPIPVTARLSRAARYALGTGTLSLAAACGSASGLFPPLDGGERNASGGEDSGYDAPPGFDATATAVPYGQFPTDLDAAIGTGTGTSADAGEDAFVGSAPPYGIPPPPP